MSGSSGRCILGPSGTGKSVTLKLMIGLLKPDSGKVCIDSEDIAHFSEEDRVRRHMGFLFQSALHSTRSRWETISHCRSAAWIRRNLRPRSSELWTRHSNVWVLIWTQPR